MQQLIVIGAGPAGSAAALRARQRDAGVTLIQPTDIPTHSPCSWLGPRALELLQQLGVAAKDLTGSAFSGLTLHSWDLQSNFAIEHDDLSGWLVAPDALDAALVRAASKAGVTIEQGQVGSASFGEAAVQCTLDNGRDVEGAVALLADGADSSTAGAAYITPAGRIAGSAATACASFETPKKITQIDVAIAASRAGQVLTLTRHGGVGRVSLMTREPEADPVALLREFSAVAATKDLMPAFADEQIVAGRSPAGLALDLDNHVGKRSLLIGEAGGFVGAFSNEVGFPSLHSGSLAAEIAVDASQSTPLQDALQEFGPRWRQELAEYLRMPNTDLALLMPLVFKNQQMAERVARAFLCGVSF